MMIQYNCCFFKVKLTRFFMKQIDFCKYLFALLLFGSNGIVASYIDLGSSQIVLLRTLTGSLFLIFAFLIGGRKFTFYKYKKQAVLLLISGMAMGASWIFLYEAYTRIGVGIASVLYYCGPIIVMALSPVLFGERLTAAKISGFVFVLTGVALLNENTFVGSGDLIGIICALSSAALYALMLICNKKATDVVGFENSVLQLFIAFLAAAIFIGAAEGYDMKIQSESILPILILGFINTGVGCYLYFSSIGQLKVQTVAVCGYLEPLSAVLLSAAVLNEHMLPLQILGTVFIIGGAVICECRFGSHRKSFAK